MFFFLALIDNIAKWIPFVTISPPEFQLFNFVRASFPFREAHLPSCALCVKTATDKTTQGKTKNIHGIVGWDKSTKEESERMFFGCEDNLWLLNRFIARIHQRWWREGGDIRSAKISREAAHPLSELRKLGCRDRALSHRFLRHHAWEDEIWISVAGR